MKHFQNNSDYDQARSRVAQLQALTSPSPEDKYELDQLNNSIQNWESQQGGNQGYSGFGDSQQPPSESVR